MLNQGKKNDFKSSGKCAVITTRVFKMRLDGLIACHIFYVHDKMIVSEKYGSDLVKTYQLDSLTHTSVHQLSDGRVNARNGSVISRLRILFVTVFLPQGYPDSVSEDYLEYQIWDTAQAFCSSITGTLATRAVLKGYGVGDETASATAATITWMLKDGTGMLGRIIFAWSKGTQLDCDAKRWRLFADFLNDVSILLDLISPLFKGYFTLVSCISGVSKSIVGVAGGATRAALTQHQARRDNMADVSAKDGSQETLVNLLALLAGLVITPMVSNSPLLVWMLFIIFTFLHLYSNYKAVSAVVMETINLPRLHILVERYMNSSVILTPKEVAKLDPVIRAPGYRLDIKLGCQLSDVIHTSDELKRITFDLPDSKCLMRLKVEKKTPSGTLYIALQTDVTHRDLLQCCFTAALLDILIQGKLKQVNFEDRGSSLDISFLLSKWNSGLGSDPNFSLELVAMAQNVAARLLGPFHGLLEQKGWNMSTTQFGADEWRLEWQNEAMNVKIF